MTNIQVIRTPERTVTSSKVPCLVLLILIIAAIESIFFTNRFWRSSFNKNDKTEIALRLADLRKSQKAVDKLLQKARKEFGTQIDNDLSYAWLKFEENMNNVLLQAFNTLERIANVALEMAEDSTSQLENDIVSHQYQNSIHVKSFSKESLTKVGTEEQSTSTQKMDEPLL